MEAESQKMLQKMNEDCLKALIMMQLKEKLEENDLSTEVSMDKIDSIVPGDQEFLEAAKEVIICLDEMTQSLEDRRH